MTEDDHFILQVAARFTIEDDLIILQVAARFMIEDDEEQMKEELKQAFR